MNAGSMAARAWSAFDALVWIAALNLAWIAFTVVGGVLLGFAPSTVAAAALVRRRARGEQASVLRDFWPHYRREFLRANGLLLPASAIVLLLLSSWQFFEWREDASSVVLAGCCLVAIAITVGIGSTLPAVYCSYDLPLRRYVGAAAALCVANPSLVLLNLMTVAVTIVAVAFVPGLIPFFALGALSYFTTRATVDFVDRNERRLATAPDATRTAHPASARGTSGRPGTPRDRDHAIAPAPSTPIKEMT